MAKLIAMLLLATLPLAAEAKPAATNNVPEDLPLIPEDVQLFKESMLWQHTLSLRTGAGGRDNVLLSPSASQGSAFATEGLDFTLSRLPLDGWGMDAIVSGDDERYLQNVPSDGTDFWLTDLTFKRYLGDHWQIGLETGANYLDEVDYVDTLTGPSALEIQGTSIRMKPSIRRDLGTNCWLEVDFPMSRDILNAPLDNIWKYGPQIQIGFSRDTASEISLSYQVQRFDHDSWPTLAADGTLLGTSTLSLMEQRVELHWRQVWARGGHWSSDTKLGFVTDDDNGEGFFNFYEYSIAERLRYEDKRWQFTGTFRASYRDYSVQRTDLITGPTLNEALLHFTFRGERRLTRWLKAYVEYDYERAMSNLPDIRYRVNTVVGGLIWEF